MKSVKILGTGCANCRTTYALVDEVARAKGVAINIEKVEDMAAIVAHGVMATPGVVIDGAVVHSGGIPSRAKVEGWFQP